jgi:hypothetical protein
MVAATDLNGYAPVHPVKTSVSREACAPRGHASSPVAAVHCIPLDALAHGTLEPSARGALRDKAPEATLLEARERQADVVVVGTRRCGWVRRMLSGSAATKLVNCSDRSILVVPVADVS